MERDGTLVDRLQTFGLSETEANIYLSVVERGEATPSTIGSAADVSASYVYQVADRLASEGLVTVDDHRSPTRIRARPPSEALEERLATLNQTVSAVERRYERPTDDHDSLEVVKSRATLTKRIESVIESADGELFLTLPVDLVGDLGGALRDAVDRGVFFLLVVAGDADELPAGRSDLATMVRAADPGMSVFAAADQQRGIISPSSLLDWKHGDSEAISFVNNSVAVAVESAFLGTTWPASAIVSRRPPADLPETYDSFRRVVYDATSHHRNGRSVEVDARVTPIDSTGDPRTITGRLVETRQNLVDPMDAEFGMENTLVVETDDGTVSVGGEGAFLEDYAASEVTLRSGE